MISRLAYVLRETWASMQRNVTLTVAAIITSAVSLLIFGLTLIIQHGFDNLLAQWEGGVEAIAQSNAIRPLVTLLSSMSPMAQAHAAFAALA